MGDFITLPEGLLVTFVSMLTVFIVLVIISILINGLKTLGAEKEVEKVEQALVEIVKEKITKEDEGLDEELVAVISAAVACSLGLNLPDINIKTIKRITNNSDAWSKMNKIEQFGR